MADTVKGFVPTAGQKVLLRQMFEATEASMKRTVSKYANRPEFKMLADRDLQELAVLKSALGV